MTIDALPGNGNPPRWRLLLASGAVVLWFGFLAVLTVTTANPVTVNRHQLLSSDSVVVGEFDVSSLRGSTATLRVHETLAGHEVASTLAVAGVERARIAGGGTYVIPLRGSGPDYRVTPAPAAFKEAPLVYPATDDVRRIVEEILIRQSPQPYH